jgi:hypothetical protein
LNKNSHFVAEFEKDEELKGEESIEKLEAFSEGNDQEEEEEEMEFKHPIIS